MVGYKAVETENHKPLDKKFKKKRKFKISQYVWSVSGMYWIYKTTLNNEDSDAYSLANNWPLSICKIMADFFISKRRPDIGNIWILFVQFYSHKKHNTSQQLKELMTKYLLFVCLVLLILISYRNGSYLG